jgi:dTDP-4-dehydrorhamnose reductase
MQTVIILGKGFIGTQLAKYFETNKIPYEIFSQAELNYTDYETFRQYISKKTFNTGWVINCSGYTGVPNVDACETNKELCYNYNVAYPLDVLRVCNSYGLPLIHVGSGCIYTGYEKEFTEDDTPNFGIFSNESSFYSKCKHIYETFARETRSYVFRIRIPFVAELTKKNYFTKLLNYDNLINENNSITSVTDFCKFVVDFIKINPTNRPAFGLYNVVNPQPIKAEEVVWLLKKHGLENPKWNFITTDQLNTKANRSNCVLSTKKIKALGLELPDTRDSLVRDIALLTNNT